MSIEHRPAQHPSPRDRLGRRRYRRRRVCRHQRLALGEPTAAALRILAVAALLWVLAQAWRWRAASPQARAGRAGFGAAYWAVVALEVALIFGGRALIVGPLDEPRDLAPWLSLVVGLHFFAFVKIFHKMTYLWLGLLVSVSAIVAFILVGSGATPAAVAVFAAIIPGSSCWPSG